MSFFDGTWGEPEFFDLPEYNNEENFKFSATKTKTEDQSIDNRPSPYNIDVDGSTSKETANQFGVNLSKSDEAYTEMANPVEENLLQQADDLKQATLPLKQSPTVISSAVPSPDMQNSVISGGDFSSFHEISNTMQPPATPSSVPYSLPQTRDHRHGNLNRKLLSPKPLTGKREKTSIDRIIDEHNKKMEEKAAARKAKSALINYAGIQKKAARRTGRKSSESQYGSISKTQNQSAFRYHGVPGLLGTRQEYQVNFNDPIQIQEFQEESSFQRMGQMQQITTVLDPFQQMGHIMMTPCLQNYNDSGAETGPKYQIPAVSANTQVNLNQFEHQNSQLVMNSLHQTGQPMINPSMEGVFNPEIKKQASIYINQCHASPSQSLQLPQSMDSQIQNHPFQQMGQANENFDPSTSNHTVDFEKPHSPLFPERNFWMPRTSNILHGRAHNQWQMTAVQPQNFGTQQKTYVGTTTQIGIHNSAPANFFQMRDSSSPSSFSPLLPTVFTPEMNDSEFSSSQSSPFSPPSSLGQINFTHRSNN
ncbi:hypothetical protein NHQ30_003723 [Ciborinia camelliae]|nr:hypothetical protein NHQ30_003723 [Ciborinia camelliae]